MQQLVCIHMLWEIQLGLSTWASTYFPSPFRFYVDALFSVSLSVT